MTLEDLNNRLANLEQSLADNITKTITQTITENFERLWGAKIQENSSNIAENTAAITALSARVDDLTNENIEKAKEIQKLTEDMDDLRNRNMRNNLVLKGFPESTGDEKENTREIVVAHLAELGGQDYDEVDNIVDRCHRGGRKDKNNNKPRNIYMNLCASRYVDFYIDAAWRKNKNTPIRHERQYTASVNERRNAAMLERKRLKEAGEIIAGYLEYPAKLMVKKAGETKYTLKDTF